MIQEPAKTVDVEQASRLLGIGRSLGYQLAREGRLPGVIRLGRRYVVSLTAIEQLLAGQRVGPAAEERQ